MFQSDQTSGMSGAQLPDTRRTGLSELLRSSTGAHPRAPGEGLHDRFAAQARRTPEAIAVSCGEHSLSYHALDLLSNHMARRLRDAGAGPESIVGLCAERSLELIVGLLGILKSGAAYVPLDPSSPADRLQFQLDDSGARILLAQPHLVSRLPNFAGRMVSLDPVPEFIPEPDAELLDAGGSSESMAYVIYTSGSTGTPKGVAVTHANVIRLFTATEHWFHLNQRDAFTLFHSFAFDFSVWEICAALLYGGRLVIVLYLVSRSPETFHNLLRAERVTVLNQTPSAFRQLVRVDERGGDLDLRLVIFGGEALELQSLRPWFNRHDHAACRLVNMYGITETTVHVTYRPITPADLEERTGASPIGRAIPDLKLYVVDDNMQPVPPGAVGEAYVGGEGLARGYLGRPGLTAERFLPDPFAARPGGRLYRSGDLVRVKRNGEIEYAGRYDRQVKIRGFRIELGEVEAALARQPELREAVVVAQAGAGGDHHLVAYIVPRAMPGPSAKALRQALRRSLPEYMVPAAYVALEPLPLTTNGKLDAGALPRFDWNSSDRDWGEFVAPRSPIKETVAAVWAEILQMKPIGIHDDFFALGGHSLLAAQVVSQLSYALGIDTPIRMPFEAPTVAVVAALIEASPGQVRSADNKPIPRIDRQGELQLSFSQQALWFLELLSPGTPVFNVTAAVRITGRLDVLALERSFDTILERHEALRTTFPAIDGRPVAVVAPHVSVRSGLIDLSALDESRREAEARRLAILEARRPFDLASGPCSASSSFGLATTSTRCCSPSIT
jgi:amino acid adenylation domain-containing protein